MTKQQIAILATLGLAVLCVLCFGGYIVISEERAYQAMQTSMVQPTATQPPTGTPTPRLTDTPTPPPAPIETPIPADTPQPPPTERPTDTPIPPTDTPMPPPPTDTPMPPTDTPTPPEPPPPVEAHVVIVAIDKREEYVDIQNTGGAPQDLTGWLLLSERGEQKCPLGGVIQPGETLRIWAMSEDVDNGGYNCGHGRPIWNNKERDPAVLYDATGQEVDRE